MKWLVDLVKPSGELRRQFSSWSIPKNLRDENSIADGMIFQITAKVSDSDFEVTNTYKITSGGEFRLPNSTSKEIESIANSSPIIKQIVFHIDLSQKIQSDFELDVSKSLSGDKNARQMRLKNAPKRPSTTSVTVVVFIRNPDVVAEVLALAKGKCEQCKKPAPFNRRVKGTPYLEVHHRTPLSKGGEDTVQNAIALCPNCHRKSHFG